MKAKHLPAEHLERYLAGEMPECDARRIADHLQSCPLCTARLHRLKADQAVMARATESEYPGTLQPMTNSPAESRILEAIHAISHTAAGTYLATQLPPGVTARRSFRTSEAAIREAAWSPDGTRLADLSDDGTIRVWTAEETEPAIVLQGTDRTGLGWTPESTAITTPGRQWDVSTGNPAQLTIAKGRFWSPDGAALAIIQSGGRISVWGPGHGQPVLLTRRACNVTSLAWSADGVTIAAGYDDGLIRIWKATDGSVSGLLGGHSGPINSLVWTHDGVLYSGGFDGSVRSWDTVTFRLRSVLGHHSDMITKLIVLAGQRLLLSISLDGILSIWSAADGALITSCRVAESPTWYTLASHPELPTVALPIGRIVHILELDTALLLANRQTPTAANSSGADEAHSLPSLADSDGYAVALVGAWGAGKTMCFSTLTSQLLENKDKRVEMFRPTTAKPMFMRYLHSALFSATRRIIRPDGSHEQQDILLVADDVDPVDPGWVLPDLDAHIQLFDSLGTDEAEKRYRSALRWSQHMRRAWAPPVVRIAIDPAANRIGEFDTVLQSQVIGQSNVQLTKVLYQTLEWDRVPRIRSSGALRPLRAYLDERRREGRIFTTVESLYRDYAKRHALSRSASDAHREFRNCIRILNRTGELISNTWSGMVLLRPELLLEYSRGVASALRQHGRLNRDCLESGRYSVSGDYRIAEPQLERLLLEQITRLLLRQRAAYDAEQEDGSQLLVSMREYPNDYEYTSPASGSLSFMDEYLARTERVTTQSDGDADWLDVAIAASSDMGSFAPGPSDVYRLESRGDVCFIGTGQELSGRIARHFQDAYVVDPIPGLTWHSPDEQSGRAVLEAALNYLESSLAAMRPRVIVTTSPNALKAVMQLFLPSDPLQQAHELPSWLCRSTTIKEYRAVVVLAGDPLGWTDATKDHLSRLISAEAS